MADGNKLERIHSELQLEEHIPKQEQGFRFQAVGIGLILAIVLFAAIGVFGDGMLSSRSDVKENVKISYEAFYRHEAKMDLTLEVNNPTGEVLISLPNDYLSKVEVVSIKPQPVSSRQENGKVTYTFHATGNTQVNFKFQPNSTGSIDAMIQVNQQSFSISHFIYP